MSDPIKAPEPAQTPRPGDAQPKPSDAPKQQPYKPGDSNAKPEKK